MKLSYFKESATMKVLAIVLGLAIVAYLIFGVIVVKLGE